MTLEHLQERLANNPRSPLFARLADELLRTGRVDEALKLCLDGLRFFPDYATAHLMVARCLAEKGEFANALPHLDYALRAYPGNGVLVGLRDAWKAKANRDLVTLAEKLSKSGKVKPKADAPVPPEVPPSSSPVDDAPIVSVTLAEIYTAQGAYEAAIAMYRKLQQQKPHQARQFETKIQELEEKIRQRT